MRRKETGGGQVMSANEKWTRVKVGWLLKDPRPRDPKRTIMRKGLLCVVSVNSATVRGAHSHQLADSVTFSYPSLNRCFGGYPFWYYPSAPSSTLRCNTTIQIYNSISFYKNIYLNKEKQF